MKYQDLSKTYKQERMSNIIRELDQGRVVMVNTLYLEEIRFLRDIYGTELKKDGCLIYRKMEREAMF